MGEDNVFTGVCQSVHSGRRVHPPGCPPPSTPLDEAPSSGCAPPPVNAPPPPKSSGCTLPPVDAPPPSMDAPPPPRQKTDYQQAVGTHPTGMHTYFKHFIQPLFVMFFFSGICYEGNNEGKSDKARCSSDGAVLEEARHASQKCRQRYVSRS